MDVFVVRDIHEFPDGGEDVKFIGVYSTEANARAAIVRLSSEPGFRDTTEGFCVHRYRVDKDHWAEGFVTLS